MVVKSRKSNLNAYFLSKQHSKKAVEDILVEFSDEFLGTDVHQIEIIFHLHSEGTSKFQDIINYLTEQKYSEGLAPKERSVFQHKVVHYILDKEVLLKIEVDERLRRCLEE